MITFRKIAIISVFTSYVLSSLFISNLAFALPQIEEADWWKRKAIEMVDSQIVSRGVTDHRVIEVIKNTPRHLFVPKEIQKFAYSDGPLPIGHGQTISQPYIVALMTELLQLKGREKVLEIGTGSGYQAAIISKLAKECYTIEIVEALAKKAEDTLEELGYKNIYVRAGDGYKGWKEHAPFDAIIITAAPEEVPEELMKQLTVGGRMVLPVGTDYQELVVIKKLKDKIEKEVIIPVRFVPMIMSE